MKHRFLLLSITLSLTATACAPQSVKQQGYLINAKTMSEMNCQELDIKINELVNAPKTETLSSAPTSNTYFAFKNKHSDELKKYKKQAALKRCYERPTYAPAAPQNKQPVLIDTQRQQLSFDQCFSKCKELTQRTNEQCFDSCK